MPCGEIDAEVAELHASGNYGDVASQVVRVCECIEELVAELAFGSVPGGERVLRCTQGIIGRMRRVAGQMLDETESLDILHSILVPFLRATRFCKE